MGCNIDDEWLLDDVLCGIVVNLEDGFMVVVFFD